MLPRRMWSLCIKECRHRYRRISKIGECWGLAPLRRGMLTLTSTPLHSGLPCQLGRCWSNASSVRSTVNTWPLASHLSKSLKVIGTDTDRSDTCDFLLTFHSNRGTVLYRFPDVARYWPKTANFPQSTPIYCPADGFPWNYVTAVGFNKPE